MSGRNGHHNWAISIGAATHNRAEDTDLLTVTAQIASDRFKPRITELRATLAEATAEAKGRGLSGREFTDFIKNATAPIKVQLPAIMWSGTFSDRKKEHLKKHSGLICIDLDHLDDRTEGWRELICGDEHTLYCMVSPSGTGLKVVYKCDPERPHNESFRAAERHVLEQFGLEADPSGKDVNRLCFVSWDPEAYLNLESEVIEYPPEPTPAPVPQQTTVISSGPTPGDDYDSRGDWRSVLRKHGWTEHGDHYWIRPGKTTGISASWDTIAAEPLRFFVFTSSADGFEANHLYRPWHIYANLEHGGDYSAAAKKLYADGFGERVKAKVQSDFDTDFADQPVPAPSKTAPPPEQRRKPSSFTLPPDDDPNTLLGERYLNRGDGAIISGTSGMGKSSLSLQMAYLWALGRDFHGIRPRTALRSLIIQSEDSDGDVAEMCLSIRHVLQLPPTDLEQIDSNVCIVTERVLRGAPFVASLRHHIEAHRPDLVWINPLQAFMDGDVTESQDLGHFLRERLNALNNPPSFGYILVHHTTKPATGKDRAERQWHEVMYDMAGGAELINWARAILSLRPAETDGDFNLVLAKRGRRAGVVKRIEDGLNSRFEPQTVLPLKHAKGFIPAPAGRKKDVPIIFWEPRAPDAPKTKEEKGGRPAKYEFKDFISLFPTKSSAGLPATQLHRLLIQNGAIERKNFHSVLKRWEEQGHVEAIDKDGEARRYRAAFSR